MRSSILLMHGGNWKNLRKVLHVLSYFAIEIANRGQCKTWEFFKAMDLSLVIEHTLTVKWVIYVFISMLDFQTQPNSTHRFGLLILT